MHSKSTKDFERAFKHRIPTMWLSTSGSAMMHNLKGSLRGEEFLAVVLHRTQYVMIDSHGQAWEYTEDQSTRM